MLSPHALAQLLCHSLVLHVIAEELGVGHQADPLQHKKGTTCTGRRQAYWHESFWCASTTVCVTSVKGVADHLVLYTHNMHETVLCGS